MDHTYWGYWYFGWGWFLLISNFGHWGYNYRSSRRYSSLLQKDVIYFLNERYARAKLIWINSLAGKYA